MFDTKLIKFIYLLYHPPSPLPPLSPLPAQPPFAANFVPLNRFTNLCNFFKLYFFFLVVETYCFLNVVNFNYILKTFSF